MNFISATTDPEGNSGIVPLVIDDIKYMTYDKLINRIVYYTSYGIFYTMGTLEYWTAVLNYSGYTFRIIDRSNSANVDKITKIDSTFKIAYFDNDKSIKCTFSIPKYKLFIKEFPIFLHNGVVVN